MVKFRHKGDFHKLDAYLKRVQKASNATDLDRFGMMGVTALASMTPMDTGETASSWYYEIERSNGKTVLSFRNSHINDGVPIAIILQYGHGTGTGGWVEGLDYINPSLQPVFEQMANDIWREVTKA